MALTPAINQNDAYVSFNEITWGAEPSVITQVKLDTGFTYAPLGSMIGTPIATPGSSYFLFDSTDDTQSLFGITYDKYLDASAFALAQTSFTFTGNIATTAGSVTVPTVGNIAGSNGLAPQLASSVITGIDNTGLLKVGASISGAGLPANAIILNILSATVILISGNVTDTTTGVTLTSYQSGYTDGLMSVATTQGSTTQWTKSALVGVNGTTDITTYVTANPNLAREYTRYNGALAIPVISFNFIG